MSEKHTPGPWHTFDNYVIRSAGGYGPSVCTLSTGTIDGPFTDEQLKANARLIAAAPSLAGLLFNLVDELQSYLESGHTLPGEAIDLYLLIAADQCLADVGLKRKRFIGWVR